MPDVNNIPENVIKETTDAIRTSISKELLGRMPEEEERFDFQDVEIIADEVKDGRLTQVVIHIPDDKEDDAQ